MLHAGANEFASLNYTSPYQSMYQGLGGLGALTDTIKDQLAQQLLTQSQIGTQLDLTAAFNLIPVADRQDVALRAIAKGANANLINNALGESGVSVAFFDTVSPTAKIIGGVLATASMAASAYHGYKRNQSVGWAIWWGLMGGLFPVITPVIAVAEGYGKPITHGFGKRRRRVNRKSRK